MKIKNKIITTFALVSVLLISIVGISAFGIGCVYSDENPLKLAPGESLEVLVNLQGDEGLQLKGSILEGADIAEFLDGVDAYNIPSVGWVNAKLKVSIPASANIGQEKVINLKFIEEENVQQGTVGLREAREKSFKVIVFEEPPIETPQGESLSVIWIVLGIVLIIIVIVIIWFLIKNKKDSAEIKSKTEPKSEPKSDK